MVEPLPSVSVVVPAYRQAALIGRCLDALQRQTYARPVEVVVVDDGCPQSTGEVAARHPLKPKVIRQPNAGVAAARNRGIAESSGVIVAFVDADDRWHPQKLERQVGRMRGEGPALCFTRYRRVDPEGVELLTEALHPDERLVPSARALAYQNFIGCSTAAVDRACLDAVGGFPDSEPLRRGGQDYALWLRIAARFPLLYVPEVLVDYTVHVGNRVGVDLVKNYQGAFDALYDTWRWDRQAFRRMTGSSYRLVAARRASHLGRVLVARRTLEAAVWGRALRSALGAVARG